MWSFMVRAGRWAEAKIQPVTALLALLMLLAYARSAHLHRLLQSQTCLAWTVLLSAFCHKSYTHLFVDVIWTLKIGHHIEKLHGSWYFLRTTIMMIFLTHSLTFLIYSPSVLFKIHYLHVIIPSPQLNNHILGFSGVLFALSFLLTTSRLDHSIEQGHFHNGHHHGLLIQGLFLIAGLQTLILPEDSCLCNNLSGILAGFVHIKVPPILVVYAMITYAKVIHPIYHTMYEILKAFVHIKVLPILMVCTKGIYVKVVRPMYYTMCETFQTVPRKLKGYCGHLFHRYSQRRGRLYTNHSNDDGHQEQREEEEEDNDKNMDSTLQWMCENCSRNNGVFVCFCEYCKEPRTL